MSGLPQQVPSVDRLVELHARAMIEFGGLPEFRVDRACLDSALAAAVNACLYSSDLDDPEQVDQLQVACHLFAYINTKQCFSDGTKRAAWLALVDCLALIGLTIECDQKEAAAFVLDHANRAQSDDLRIGHVANWVTERLRPMQATVIVQLPNVPPMPIKGS